MAIVNRDKDVSEQQASSFASLAETVTAEVHSIFQAPHACEINALQLSTNGVSASPTAAISIRRFVVGAGSTLIPQGPALALTAIGTSGPQAYAFSATPSMQAGDELVVTHGGAGSAVKRLQCSLVFKALQDIKSWDY
jgi:hypothetical protein